MNLLTVFHGSNQLFESVNLLKSQDKRDFGKGFYTTQQAIEQLQYFKPNNQLSIHTETALSELKLQRRTDLGK